MIRKISTLALLLAGSVLVPQPGAAQLASGAKVGVVSVRALLQGSPQTREKIKAIQDEFSQKERSLEAKTKELKDRQAKLQKDMQVMGAEERRNAEARYRDDARDLDRRINEFREDLNVRQNEVMGRLQEDLIKDIRAYAAQSGYDIVISEAGDVLWVTPGIDLTAKVMASIEAKAGKPAAAAPKPAAKP